MNFKRTSLFFIALLAVGYAAGQAKGIEAAQTKSATPNSSAVPENTAVDWISYRNVYKLMLQFEKYGKPKQLIQRSYRVQAKEKSASIEDLQLTLRGKTVHLDLPIDVAGRILFPLLKTAYDENAEIQMNQAVSLYTLQARMFITPRADGIYEVADLRTACEQIRDYLMFVGDLSSHDKRCSGVRFSYLKSTRDVAVRFKAKEQSLAPMQVKEGGAFQDDLLNVFKVVAYRFADWPDQGQVITQNTPIAITALFD